MTSPLVTWCTIDRTAHGLCYYLLEKKDPQVFYCLVNIHWLWFVLLIFHDLSSFHTCRYLTSGRLLAEGFSTYRYGL